jgi:hypothetical protein
MAPVDPSPAEQLGVRRGDDGVDFLVHDVALHELDVAVASRRPHGSSLAAERAAGKRRWASPRIAGAAGTFLALA